MLNLLAISYNNIGPFKDTPISIFFETGKYLIKAPIGTGKSFLFFDGPIYGLYKYSNRNMLNNQSKEGNIKILFELNQETRLITRTITKAKTKESCTSKLYKTGPLPTSKIDNILQYNTDIQTILRNNAIELEEIIFKNETDLQQTIQDMLPLREVFLNTVFLMQDSENIFELLPSERLTVLKNVFGLLGIDEAKEIISEKKKEITYKLKAYTDTSKYDEKIKELIIGYTQNYDKLLNDINKIDGTSGHTTIKSSIQELKMIQEKIQINELEESIFSLDIDGYIDNIIIDNKNKYQKTEQLLENYKEEIKNKKNTIDNKRQERIIIENNNGELIKNINNLNPEILTHLKQQKQGLNNEQEILEQSIPQTTINTFLTTIENNELTKDCIIKSTNITLPNTYLLIQHLTNQGKSLQEEINTFQLTIKNEELKKTHSEETIKTEIKNQQEKEKNLTTQYNQINGTIQEFEQNITSQATFSCEKIGENCPFIKIINQKTFDQLESQKQQFIQQKDTIQKEITIIQKNLIDKQQLLESLPKNSNSNQIIVLEHKIKICEKQIQTIKDFLTTINWKQIQANYESYTKIQENINIIDKKIISQELMQKEIESYKQQKEKNEGILVNLEEQINTLLKEIEEKQNQLTQEETKLKTLSYETIISAEKTNIQVHNYQRDIISLIHDYKRIQLEINQLKEEEKQLNNLYTIFSKELLLLVLQDHLPILNDIINNYLSQIVDYQISLSLNKSSTDKLELEANIIDNQGSREIKSLSGGQKIILKLVWMIAISSYMNSPILFLDETINNLDIDTVSKVADMLEDFVKQRNMKLYTVTHNQQIQDMNIWDQIITITR